MLLCIQFSMMTGGVLPGPVIMHLSEASWAGLPPSRLKLMVILVPSTLGVLLISVADRGTAGMESTLSIGSVQIQA